MLSEDWIGITAADYGLRPGRGILGDGTLDPSYFTKVSVWGVNQGTATGHGQFVFNTNSLALMWDGDGAGMAYSGVAIATLPVDPWPSYPSDPKIRIKVIGSAVNHDPVVESINLTIDRAAALRVGSPAIAIGATDADYDVFTYGLATSARFGSVSFDTAAGTFVYKLTDPTASTDTFTIKVNDGYGGAAQQSVTLNFHDFEVLPPDTLNIPNQVNIIDTSFTNSNIGAPDPAGIVYIPELASLFVSDSEVDEFDYDPFTHYSSSAVDPNLYKLGLSGNSLAKFDLSGYTKEPTGLAYNPIDKKLYISDDDLYKVFWVDPANPQIVLGSFSTKPAGGSDPEDIAINPKNGNVFIANGTPSHTIVEVTTAGKLVSKTTIPDEVEDMEALAYDPLHDVFFVGGGFSDQIYIFNRSGEKKGQIDLSPYRGHTRVHVKDMAFGPKSTDPTKVSLYVVDYGNTHNEASADDGRILEVSLGAGWDNIPLNKLLYGWDLGV